MQRECGFGHLYDTDQFASCPYCNNGARAISFDNGGAGRTSAPMGFGNYGGAPAQQESYGRTVAPGFSPAPTTAPNPAAAPAEEGGRTVMPEWMRNEKKNKEEGKTIAIFPAVHGIDPVVGWLVCTEGPGKGKDYRLFGRINTIGRSEENDVVLSSEKTVSKKDHARLAYDAKHNNFQLIPGQGTNLAYLNDAPLYVPQPLHAYDLIEFGDTKLIFIPLCNDQFQWSQGDK